MLRVALRIAGQLASEMVAPSLNGTRRAKASGAIGYAKRGMIMKITTMGIDRPKACFYPPCQCPRQDRFNEVMRTRPDADALCLSGILPYR